MTQEELEDWEMVLCRMETEGFHYCFQSYSTFGKIGDQRFHELRKEEEVKNVL